MAVLSGGNVLSLALLGDSGKVDRQYLPTGSSLSVSAVAICGLIWN
jgi:hypothetical protein